MFDSIDWATWGFGLLIVFPILVIALGEFKGSLEQGAGSSYATPIAILRNGVLPLAFIDILVRKVAGVPGDHLLVKIVDTAFWIVALNSAVAIFNILFFGEGSPLAGRIQIPKLLLDLLRSFLVVCGGSIIVSRIWGIDLSSLITALGVGSLVIGLALQDTLGSLFAGIAMVSARQFRVGDWIKFGNDEGIVHAMSWRSVAIKTRGGDLAFVPNGIIARQPFTVLAGGVGSTTVGVETRFPFTQSPDQVCALLVDAAKATANFHLDPAPSPRLVSFEDNGIRYFTAVRVTDPQKLYAVRSEFLANIWYMAQRQGIAFVGELNSDFPQARPTQSSPAVSPLALAQRIADASVLAISAEKLLPLTRNARLQLYRAGQPIVQQGAVSPFAYVVLGGRARAVVRADGKTELQLHEFDKGQFLLAKAFLRGNGCPYELRASTEMEVVAIPLTDFREFTATNQEFARDIEQILSAREDASERALAKAFPSRDGNGSGAELGDRMQLLKDVFRT